MSKVLVIEDNEEINQLLCEMLKKEQIETISAFSGTEGLLYLERDKVDVILLDLMLPGKSGEDTLAEIRKTLATPVIIISAKNDIEGRVGLLESGADDYITKPFDLREVMARIRLQMNRSIPKTIGILHNRDLMIDKENRIVKVKESEVNLTRQEFNILVTLMESPNKAFTKQELFESAWEEYYFGADKTINVHISNIRNKFKQITPDEYIETVWGIGFRAIS